MKISMGEQIYMSKTSVNEILERKKLANYCEN